ncbi:ATP-binding cassette alpha-factor transporter STE6 [Sugiyamaella lignohabitans]|uniref:ATP-binding cassette alpha-factor transporter STE6 n=1 Tax=Sugiyamaella lignohabitans TaxID=796027 RepID=A0A167EX52_9ASCO|nr:ATP-binding cassette alpha-factor transporter STE6 [Sugiyamaella lignohabitans]ANB14562.1 ATP-binding cassette alpha-factor transporter STE6 [Sugiyamaella lignohabitans]
MCHILITIKINFKYPTRNEMILDGFNINIKAGQLSFIVGRSGSGKSTLGHILLKQYERASGAIFIDGLVFDTISPRWLCDNIFVVEQQSILFDVSIDENIKLAASRATNTESIRNACDQFFVSEFVGELPQGWKTNAGLQGKNLSGGQKQRISLARARLRNTPIMIFDESFSALDPQMRAKCLEEIRKYRADKTTIIITHELAQINPDDYLYIMESGNIVEHGLRKDLEADSARLNFLADLSNSSNRASEDLSFSENWFPDLPSKRHSRVDESIAHRRQSTIDPYNQFISEDEQIDSKVQAWKSKKRISTTKLLFQLINSLPNKIVFGIGIVSAVLNAITNPLFSFAFSNLLNGIIYQKQMGTSDYSLTRWTVIVIAIAIGDGITTYGRTALDIASETWLRHARVRSLRNILDRELLDLNTDTESSLTSLLMNDSESVRLLVSRFTSGVISCVILGVFAIVWSMISGWQLSLVGLSFIPCFYFSSAWYKSIVTKWEALYREETTSVIGLIDEVVAGIKSVKLLALENYFKKEVDKREMTLNAIAFRRAIFIGLGFGVNQIFMYITQAIILYYGMTLISDGKYSVQQAMMVFTLLIFSLVTLEQTVGTIPILSNGFETCREILDLMKRSPSMEKAKAHYDITKGSIKFENVGFWYSSTTSTEDSELEGSGTSPVLLNFNLEVNSNEVVAITGRSGCGKSTLARLVTKLYSPQRGTISVDGNDISDLSTRSLRKKIAIVSQMPLSFFEGTIADNLRYGMKDDRTTPERQQMDLMRQACRESGLDEFIMSLEEGYETKMGSSSSSGSLLSGGQLQRLGIARALLRSPKILILDECTSALDAESIDIIKQMIKYHRTVRDMTIIIITHQEEMTDGVDRVIKM